MRVPIIAGNWKMYKTGPETKEFADKFKPLVNGKADGEIVLCPPFTALELLSEALRGTNVALGAQNMHWEAQGAFTGEISPLMLKAAGCKYVILGHSERREYFGESDELINRKVKAAIANGLIPILCVGEKLEHREAGTTETVIRTQLLSGLQGVESAAVAKMVIAYEPVWAIGTGKTASSGDAEQVSSFIRYLISATFGSEAGQTIRIQYGGSVKPGNAAELLGMPNIDGALVGGASLDPEAFARIIDACKAGA